MVAACRGHCAKCFYSIAAAFSTTLVSCVLLGLHSVQQNVCSNEQVVAYNFGAW